MHEINDHVIALTGVNGIEYRVKLCRTCGSLVWEGAEVNHQVAFDRAGKSPVMTPTMMDQKLGDDSATESPAPETWEQEAARWVDGQVLVKQHGSLQFTGAVTSVKPAELDPDSVVFIIDVDGGGQAVVDTSSQGWTVELR